MSTELALVRGKEAFLRPLLETDADGPYPGWFNDEETCKYNSHYCHPVTPESCREYIRSIARSTSNLVLAICANEDARHVGNVSLTQISTVSRNAQFSIILGDSSIRGKGVGYFAFYNILKHGFFALNLHRIYWGTPKENLPMIAMSKRIGAKKEGVRREALFKNGRYLDYIDFGLLRSEFPNL